MEHTDVLVIGGGFFGMYLSEFFALRGRRSLLCEKETDFMTRASYVNQARVHHGYHYPRSVLTARRSRMSFPRFVAEFRECIDDTFESYYLVGRILGKITSQQFHEFCHRIDAPCVPAANAIRQYLDSRLIEDAFLTTECAFNAVKLRRIMHDRMRQAGVERRTRTLVERVEQADDGAEIVATLRDLDRGETYRVRAGQAYNCTYAMINALLAQSGLPIIPLKHELTEMCLVEMPEELRGKAFTVMCGPFFSVMPFPARGLHSFSHVRYTPHFEWADAPGTPYHNAHERFARAEKTTAWSHMIRDAQRYVPLLADCRYRESLWEVKTVLPRSETDDSRPILFRAHHGLQNLHCLMGGKIDNVYDVVNVIEKAGLL